MAKRGHNGYLVLVVGDITRSVDKYVLVNAGNSYSIHSESTLQGDLDALTEGIEEDNNFRLWYNMEMV